MRFIVTIQPLNAGPGGQFNISEQVEAADLIEALEVAKAQVLKTAQTQARAIFDALPAAAQGQTKEAPG